ncbi:MAG: sulfite exporter TauE/SafE family protein [Gemmobacter sp.]|jgi:uncharacterized membrane protein YfcA|nr:sulfite exporter TauE/SafE family protein [Gemmobacter sp.]
MFADMILVLSGFAAGALNAAAGGGTFIVFPALVWAGVSAIPANATATFASMPGYFAGAWGFRKDIHAEGSLRLWQLAVVTLLGGLTGALLLLVTPSDLFDGLVPWLLLLATALFAFGPRILAAQYRRGRSHAGPLAAALLFGLIGVYGGYFNGGLGILFLAGFGLIGFSDMNTMNGLKVLLSGLMAIFATLAFAAAGLIAWREGLIMAVATTAGGWLGARFARRLPQVWLRGGVIVTGLVMTAIFLAR